LSTGDAQLAHAGADLRIAERWRISLHEGGHAVAGRRLLGQTARAVVYDDNCGAAYTGSGGVEAQLFEDALTIAAGPAAEALAADVAPPSLPSAPPLEATYGEGAKFIKEDMRRSLRDPVIIARWCIAGVEGEPDRWANRFFWLQREAAIFVAMHRRAIVQAATDLFAHGIVTLPAEPAQKGTEHVD
jgi:hypothetical protein